MRKFKEIMIIVLIASMSLGLMACGSKETDKNAKKELSAEELVANIPFDKNENFTANMIYKMDLSYDMKQMLIDTGTSEEEISEAIDNGEISEDDLNMNIKVGMDATLNTNGNFAYLNGTANVSGMGEIENLTLQSYIDNSNNENPITYSYDEASDIWYIAENEDSYSAIPDVEIFTKYVKSAKITDDNDDEYTLNVIIDLVKLHKDNPETMEEAFNISSLGDADEIIKALNEMEFIFKIEKDTNNLLYMSVDYKDILNNYFESLSKEEEGTTNYFTINEYRLEIKYHDYNKTKVTIPDEVKNTTVKESDIIFDDTNEEKETLIYDESSLTLFNIDDEQVCTLSIPEGFKVSDEFCTPTYFSLEDNINNMISIMCDNDFWIVKIANGETYLPDYTSFSKDEITKLKSIETEKGTVDIYVNSYIFLDDESQVEYKTYYLILNIGSDYITVEAYESILNDYDISIDDLTKTIFQ